MTFNYRGRDAGGAAVSGTIEAENRQMAIRELRRRGIFITSCQETVVAKPSPQRGRFIRRAIGRRDLALFSRQLATMLGAGLPIINALNILRKQVEKPAFRDSIAALCRDLESGEAFYQSLARQPQVYPAIFTHTVEAGELSGSLEETLQRLAEHLEREHELEEKVKSALTYPAVVSVVAVLVVIFLLTYILPTFQGMLLSMEVPLPWPTRMVLGISELLQRWWLFMLLFMAIAVFAVYRWSLQPAGRYQLDRMLLRLPIFGPLHHKTVLSRFSRTLGTLLHSGVPVLIALDVVRRTLGNMVVAEAVARAGESIREGQSLAAPLEESGLFPPMLVEMIIVGEETGALDALLGKISSFYDAEVGETVGRLSTLIEPVLIISLGGIIGLIVISVLMPIFTMYGGLQ